MRPKRSLNLKKARVSDEPRRNIERLFLITQQVIDHRVPVSGYVKSSWRFSVMRSAEPKKNTLSLTSGPPRARL